MKGGDTLRGEGKATSLREGGGGVSFGRKGEDVLFSEGRGEGVLFPGGRGKMFSFRKEGGRCSLSGRKGLMSFIWEEGGLDIVTCRERDS